MLTSERKRLLLTVSSATAASSPRRRVSQELGLSEDTIRRDLRELAAEEPGCSGAWRRAAGRAGRRSVSPAGRRVGPEGKRALATRGGGDVIEDGRGVVILDGGTTGARTGAAVAPRPAEATIVTHSPSSAERRCRMRASRWSSSAAGARFPPLDQTQVGAIATEQRSPAHSGRSPFPRRHRQLHAEAGVDDRRHRGRR